MRRIRRSRSRAIAKIPFIIEGFAVRMIRASTTKIDRQRRCTTRFVRSRHRFRRPIAFPKTDFLNITCVNIDINKRFV